MTLSRHTARHLALIPFAALVPLLAVTNLHAYSVFPYTSGSETLYLKWADNHAGSAGGTVTWSFIPAGTPGSATFCADACPGTSVANLSVEIAPGAGFVSTPLVDLESRIRAAMRRWSAATGIRFIKLAGDNGVAINDPAAMPNATGHIRIGVFAFASGGGAVGYAPPPNGGTGAGDILFDANSFYQFAPGGEGDVFDQTYAPNDIEGLFLHELGHAIGLAHPPIDGNCPVMQIEPACRGRINRQLDADDIAGATFLYGSLFYNGFED